MRQIGRFDLADDVVWAHHLVDLDELRDLLQRLVDVARGGWIGDDQDIRLDAGHAQSSCPVRAGSSRAASMAGHSHSYRLSGPAVNCRTTCR